MDLKVIKAEKRKTEERKSGNKKAERRKTATVIQSFSLSALQPFALNRWSTQSPAATFLVRSTTRLE
jgi:hypothetical protein